MARDVGTGLVGRLIADPRTASWSRLGALVRRLELSPPVAALPDASIASLVEADVAIVSGSMAVYEAVACGVATVVVGGARGTSSLAAGGAVAGLPGTADEERIAAAVTALVTSPRARGALVRAGRAMVDGLGAERVADCLLARLAPTKALDVGVRRVG
jgi:spore coat polysaccharide biosynthesis predicted glycosyltransferase SpsG